MVYSNAEKFQHGKNAQINIYKLLESCKTKNYIETLIESYRVGRSDFSNSTQFYAPFLISFSDGESWIIYSTTSMRTDRIKGQQWDTYNLKEINSSISKSFLVFPDSINNEERAKFENQNEKYKNKDEYSAVDAIISQDALYNLIENKANSSFSLGKLKDIQGRNFEDRIAMCLSDKENLSIFKTGNKTLTGIHYNFFKIILDYIGIAPNDIEFIKATTDKKDIGKLPSGGNPKTDVFVNIKLLDGSSKQITISCKKSSAQKVSVHEYNADSFAEILDAKNQNLNNLLHRYQDYPTLSAFGEDNCKAMTEEIRPYNKKLSRWVLAGIDGYGDPEVQWASHILTYDNNNNSIAFHSVDEYIDNLIEANVSGNFGTLFSWTYPSKKRGRTTKCIGTIKE